MALIGFSSTEWVYFLKNEKKFDLKSMLENPINKEIKSEYLTWQLITVLLPFVTFFFVFLLNIFTFDFINKSFFEAMKSSFSSFNNGSLPIISFSILTSGMPFLLEKLTVYPEYHLLRRRVMAISMIFLFLSASLYVIQTLNIYKDNFNTQASILQIILGCYVFLFACSIGFKMYLLQSTHIIDYEGKINKNVENLSNSVNDMNDE